MAVLLAITLCAIYWLFVAASDSTALTRRDALAKNIKRGMERAEVGYLAATVGGDVQRDPNLPSKDFIQFFGGQYALVRWNGVHRCVDAHTIVANYSRAQTLVSASTLDARYCRVGSTVKEM